MSGLTASQSRALEVAHAMVDVGIPVFTAARNHGTGHEFLLPKAWQHTMPSHDAVSRWRPGMAICAVTGVIADVIDTDPRNGGHESRTDLVNAGVWPRVYGVVATPGGGTHEYITRTGVAKAVLAKGIDLQAGGPDGQGRGFVYLPPTERVAKGGPRAGQVVEYAWTTEPDLAWLGDYIEGDGTTEHLTYLVRNTRPARRTVTRPCATPSTDDDDPFDTAYSAWDQDSAWRVIRGQLAAVEAARDGAINSTLGGAARLLGRFVGSLLDEDTAAAMLMEALAKGGVHSDAWNVANGRTWTGATVIAAGLANGQAEPWAVMATEPEPEPTPVVVMASSGQPVPALCITTAAEMAYWLQGSLGSGSLSGFFARGGQVVHTPRVDEAGYVPPKGDHDENGPAQIQPVSPGQLAAKVQYAHRCYKIVRDKETKEEREVPALFPLESAKRAVDAPEAMVMLRSLKGVTHTPMVRADGSILEVPGYDMDSGYLFLPGQGVNVSSVPANPTEIEVKDAVALLDEMVAGFPWNDAEDRANYYGLLLTPLLRLLSPPSYKGFFIGAHQPGSGKTLLADVARILHGGIFRSDMPADEKEIKSMSTSLLATTSAPVVQVDNVTGVLRSSYMAGLLTSTGELQERELGKSSMLEFTNDRVWVFTGNNPSLGGDIVRRMILVMIDPNMADPETREFAIKDLPAWVRTNRNRLLHALLVMVRHWVACGRPLAVRQQSDSFATWEATVAGILERCGVPGQFDQQSGKRAAAGGDDDGLAQVLERIWEQHADRDWSVAEILSSTMSTDVGDFVMESRDWLPSVVLDKLARSEAAGRKTMGHWLRNRLGRWVSGSDGHSYVVREAGKDRLGARWRVERTA
jgi:hypothetical protein